MRESEIACVEIEVVGTAIGGRFDDISLRLVVFTQLRTHLSQRFRDLRPVAIALTRLEQELLRQFGIAPAHGNLAEVECRFPPLRR